MTKEIELSKQGWKYRGKFVSLVDDADYEYINSFAWSYCVLSGRSYAITTFSSGERRQMLMHQMIIGVNDGMDIDHIDGDGLNNTRSNLRMCTRAENIHNQIRRSGNKKGTSRLQSGRYSAKIMSYGVSHWLGTFDSQNEASRAYNEAAIKYHGEFARLNEVIESKEPVKRSPRKTHRWLNH